MREVERSQLVSEWNWENRDDSGRRQPIPIEGSEFFLEADMVIPAVGQAPDLSFLPPDFQFGEGSVGCA